MKNAPVTAEHTMVAAGLLMALRQIRKSTPDSAYEASIERMAQALADLGARLQHKAWREGYLQGRDDAIKEEFHAHNFWTDNPYPKLDP